MSDTHRRPRKRESRRALDLPEGDYIVVPLELGTQLPRDIVALAPGVWLAYRECEPVRSAATNEMMLLSEGNDGSLERMEDGLLRRHALVVAAEAGLQGSTEIGDYDAEAVLTRHGLWFEPVLRLAPVIERPLAALLLAQPIALRYSACLRVRIGHEGVRATDHIDVGEQVAGYLRCLERSCEPRVFSAAQKAGEVLRALSSCAGGWCRPVAAVDVFYHALLEDDWRIRLLLLVVALESLLGSRRSLARRVSARAAALAYGRGALHVSACRRLKDLYTTRSDFVHGRDTTRDGSDVAELWPKVAFLEETVRLCLLRILRDVDMTRRFCGTQGRLEVFLDEVVLAST